LSLAENILKLTDIILMNNFKKKVTYYYDEEFGTFNYSTTHPMKPLRVAITDDLVGHYGLK
jgi:histone deacetylase 1/2